MDEQLQFDEVGRGNGVEKGKRIVDEAPARLFNGAGIVEVSMEELPSLFGWTISLIYPREPDL